VFESEAEADFARDYTWRILGVDDTIEELLSQTAKWIIKEPESAFGQGVCNRSARKEVTSG
jgi:hypothetical protein